MYRYFSLRFPSPFLWEKKKSSSTKENRKVKIYMGKESAWSLIKCVMILWDQGSSLIPLTKPCSWRSPLPSLWGSSKGFDTNTDKSTRLQLPTKLRPNRMPTSMLLLLTWSLKVLSPLFKTMERGKAGSTNFILSQTNISSIFKISNGIHVQRMELWTPNVKMNKMRYLNKHPYPSQCSDMILPILPVCGSDLSSLQCSVIEEWFSFTDVS